MNDKSLTPKEFKNLMSLIQRKYAFGYGGRIKYIDPSFDMRDGRCFTITFRNGMHTETTFSMRDVKDTMYNDIVEWLEDLHKNKAKDEEENENNERNEIVL